MSRESLCTLLELVLAEQGKSPVHVSVTRISIETRNLLGGGTRNFRELT